MTGAILLNSSILKQVVQVQIAYFEQPCHMLSPHRVSYPFLGEASHHFHPVTSLT